MKKAVILICFGSKNIDLQLEKLKKKIIKNFYGYSIYICFTSNFFIKKYGYGIDEILNNIYINNYEKIICLPIFTIDGIEYEKALTYINNYKGKIKSIKISKPLLYYEENFIDIYSYINGINKQNVLYICHGTDDKSNYKYKKLFSMFKEKNIFFSNLENEPYIETTIKIIKEKNINNLYVKPFLLFNGKHIEKDIAYNIKNVLLQNNINIILDLKPLLQYDEIVDIFIKNLIKSKEI
ncbi:sirohydrochlorin cobaltochelatase [[Clostridium] colinum]|uniref:sirohydrochlorin cobaltochelatase n=1 Tax=[Clostridium] colinum TaxID=36835 RepID=UPI0020249417|nr:sirohydrochlorin cobaltochelatase [[Clostridium] colinum]